MIEKIKLSGFRGKTAEYEFGKVVKMFGKNGTGKTTLAHAICFAMTGTDSHGNRAPVHLISTGEDRLEVEIKTSRAVIRRSLTRAKNGTLKLIRGDVPTDLSQEQFEQLLAPADVFRSVFIPGYFVSGSMNADRRRRVLAQLLPPVDRMTLLEEMSGLKVTDQEVVAYKLDSGKRADLIASGIGEHRRRLERELSANGGRIAELKNLPELPAEPVKPVAAAQLKQVEGLRRQWGDYRQDLRAWESRQLRFERVADDNAKRESERKALEAELKILEEVEVPSALDLMEKEKGLHGRLQQAPPKPSFASVPNSENCPTCGQVVGKKHRERVASENSELMARYEKGVAAVHEYNKQVEEELFAVAKEIEELSRQINEARAHNDKVRVKRSELQMRLGALREETAEDPGPRPEPPTEALPDDEQTSRLEEVAKSYEREKAVYDDLKGRHAQAAERIRELERENASLREGAERAGKLEQCVKLLPQEELKRQSQHLSMNNYVLDPEGADVTLTHKDGRPLNILSRGEAMKACNSLSLKLNSLMERKINMIFVDNAEAIDDPGVEELADGGRQVFLAYVDKSCDSLKVS